MKAIRTAVVLAAMMGFISVCGIAARPTSKAGDKGQALRLESVVPKQFGEWVELPDHGAQVVNPQTRERITIPGGKVPRFTAGSQLKQAVKGG